ncbi:MAG: hypothetical protein GKS05_08050 [Nitrospirales bacterium]|nr:hypothetical protein [Nitrospirales bacterium]
MNQEIELRVSYRYTQEHPWVIQGITGFLSAYFMAKPDFRLQRHKEDLATGMHVWVCETPPNMNVLFLLRRLQTDIPPCHVSQVPTDPELPPQYLIDCLPPESSTA